MQMAAKAMHETIVKMNMNSHELMSNASAEGSRLVGSKRESLRCSKGTRMAAGTSVAAPTQTSGKPLIVAATNKPNRITRLAV